MKFIDKAIIHIQSGAGGNGAIAWRREKFVAFGGPAGGDGGRGGSVYIEASSSMNTLLEFTYQSKFEGESGVNGSNKNCHGRAGKDLVIKVPCGTVIKPAGESKIIADLREDGQRVLVAQGGRGGRGNARFCSTRQKAPHFAEPGEPPIERKLELELKLLADVGIIGLPNAGKSTFISVVSSAKPKIADYPFTTIVPNLGVVKKPNGDGVVMVDIPGLIEGASEGVGLGHDFLRHVERTQFLLHLVDIATPSLEADGVCETPIEQFQLINRELEKYSPRLAQKPQWIVLTKVDSIPAEWVEAYESRFKAEQPNNPIFSISSVGQQGLEPLLNNLFETMDTTEIQYEEIVVEEDPDATDNDDSAFIIHPGDPGVYEITGGRVERFVQMTDMTSRESIVHLTNVLKSMGVFKALAKAGAKHGDSIYIANYGFDFVPE